MTRLDNWACVTRSGHYTAPELGKLRLAGRVKDYPSYTKWRPIWATHLIISSSGRTAKTKDITYQFGRINPEYRKWLRENRPSWDWRNPIIKKGES